MREARRSSARRPLRSQRPRAVRSRSLNGNAKRWGRWRDPRDGEVVEIIVPVETPAGVVAWRVRIIESSGRPGCAAVGDEVIRYLAGWRRLKGAETSEPLPVPRPRTRGECAEGPRPCPWVSCRYHLYLDVNAAGGVKLNFPDLEPDELPESCVLDVAERGAVELDAVAGLVNVTRTRVEQLQRRALENLRRLPVLQEHHHG